MSCIVLKQEGDTIDSHDGRTGARDVCGRHSPCLSCCLNGCKNLGRSRCDCSRNLIDNNLNFINIYDLDNITRRDHGSWNSPCCCRSQLKDCRLHRAGAVTENDIVAADSGNSSLARDNFAAGCCHG
jgi:hypothetical protein